jgi:hypothetical protein
MDVVNTLKRMWNVEEGSALLKTWQPGILTETYMIDSSIMLIVTERADRDKWCMLGPGRCERARSVHVEKQKEKSEELIKVVKVLCGRRTRVQ